ncbi:hypothetical protein JTF06_09255 [Desemzia sp. RIT804]|uniref:hypothetical protein n=1 Tax=Desemzia sp. RIT 804 TaxID=2810209 RepID=UPI00194F99F4|nr:hypothetical protein [Desemzia sp. RIT 804]MBM6615071.1 hypothetical protein [Desemzia sp. RIT 804]
MKLLLLALTLLMFAGCGDEEFEAPGNNEVTTSSEIVEEEFEQVPEEDYESADPIQATDYPELSAIQEEIDLDTVEGHLVTDNPGTRVIIFVEDGQQAYKSIYIKSDNRLKLVDFKANELLIDEELAE